MGDQRDDTTGPAQAAVPLLKASEVAKLFGVNPKTVYAWIQHGKLPAIRTPMGGVRIEAKVVASLLSGPGEKTS